jgi:hypothetical protein
VCVHNVCECVRACVCVCVCVGMDRYKEVREQRSVVDAEPMVQTSSGMVSFARSPLLR